MKKQTEKHSYCRAARICGQHVLRCFSRNAFAQAFSCRQRPRRQKLELRLLNQIRLQRAKP